MLALLSALRAVTSLLGISGTLSFLKSLPDLIKIIGEIIKAIREVKGAAARREKTIEIKDALTHARETGDTSRLESLYK